MTSGSIRPPMTQTLSAVSRLIFKFCLPQVAHTEAGAPTASANLNLTPNLSQVLVVPPQLLWQAPRPEGYSINVDFDSNLSEQSMVNQRCASANSSTGLRK